MHERITRNINNNEDLSPESANFDLEKYILYLQGGSGSGSYSGATLLTKYENLEENAKKIAEEEIVRYVKAVHGLKYSDILEKEKEITVGINEIIEDAKIGRRARLDLSSFERDKIFTQAEQDNFETNLEKGNQREIEEKRKEENLIRKIKQKYKKLFESEDNKDK